MSCNFLRKESLIDYSEKNEMYLLKKASLIDYSGKNTLYLLRKDLWLIIQAKMSCTY